MKDRANFLTALLVWSSVVFGVRAEGVFDADPKHPWNRLNDALFVRRAEDGTEFGRDDLDILFWRRTYYLLNGPSQKGAIEALDEFISAHHEKLIADPWKRAMLQRRLWTLFDWTADPLKSEETSAARRALQERLVKAIGLVALSPADIEALPDGYADLEKAGSAKELLRGLNDTNSAWINVHLATGALAAKAHAEFFGGRSIFETYIRLPGGREAGVKYLKAISDVTPQWVASNERDADRTDWRLNKAFPEFPSGTQWALVRRMFLIDSSGKIRATRVIESIQVRTYHEIARMTDLRFVKPGEKEAQTFNEFRLVLAPVPKMVSIGENERHFESINFFSKGIDPFEREVAGQKMDVTRAQSKTLETCRECHGGAGLGSVLTFTRTLSGERAIDTTLLTDSEGNEKEENRVIYSKQRQYSWGLMQGLLAAGQLRGGIHSP